MLNLQDWAFKCKTKVGEHSCSKFPKMDSVTRHLTQVKSSLETSIHNLYANIEHKVPENIDLALKSYAHALANTSKDEALSDLALLKITPATVTISLTTVAMVFFLNKLFKSSLSGSKPAPTKKKKKKLTKTQKANKEIQAVLDFVEETYVPQIEEFFEKYSTISPENREYKFKYFEEMLLKELMKLDGIDTAGNDVLRENRKKVIKFIQLYQKKLDQFKSENP